MQPSQPHTHPSFPLALAVAAALPILAAAGPARALAGLEARYTVTTTGVEFGRARLSLEPEDGGAAVGFTFENGAFLGLVDASLTRMRTSLRREGRELLPHFYTGLFEKEDRTREIDATFGDDGAMATFELVKRGRVRVDRVPEGLPPGTVDPLTAIVRARAWLEGAVEGDAIPLEVFDGRKRYAVGLRYLGTVQASQGREARAAHRVAVRYRLTAELDEDEGGGWLRAEDARERDLDALVSADGRYVPLRLTGSFDGLPLTAVLAAECPAPPGCAPEE